MLWGEESFGLFFFTWSTNRLKRKENLALPENEIIKKREFETAEQLLRLTSIGKSHCCRDLEWPLFRYLSMDALSGFGKAYRLFNRDQITKIDV